MRIKDLRIENGLTQKELAKILQSSDKNIWAYENGVASPPIDILIAYANYFGVSTDYLLGRTDELGAVITPFPSTDNYTDEEKKLIADYRELTPPLKRMIQETLKTWKSSEINTKKLS